MSIFLNLLSLVIASISVYVMYKTSQRQHQLEEKRIRQDNLKIRVELFNEKSKIYYKIIDFNEMLWRELDFKPTDKNIDDFFKIKKDIKFLFKNFEPIENYLSDLLEIGKLSRQIENKNYSVDQNKLSLEKQNLINGLHSKFELAKEAILENTKLWI